MSIIFYSESETCVKFVIKLTFSYIWNNHLALEKAEHVSQELSDSKSAVTHLMRAHQHRVS